LHIHNRALQGILGGEGCDAIWRVHRFIANEAAMLSPGLAQDYLSALCDEVAAVSVELLPLRNAMSERFPRSRPRWNLRDDPGAVPRRVLDRTRLEQTDGRLIPPIDQSSSASVP
jgi:hypothetical protein